MLFFRFQKYLLKQNALTTFWLKNTKIIILHLKKHWYFHYICWFSVCCKAISLSKTLEIDWIWGIGLRKKEPKSLKNTRNRLVLRDRTKEKMVDVHGTLETKLELAGQPWPRQSPPLKPTSPERSESIGHIQTRWL